MARKKDIIVEDSNSSESEDLNHSKTTKIPSSEVEETSDEEEEMVYNAYTDPVGTVKFPLELKLRLSKEIKAQNKRKTSSFKIALKYLDWNAIKIDGYATADLKACLEEMMKPICSIRTLDEILTDYENHHEKYDLKMHPDAPKVPRNAVMRYIDDNRDKFKRTLTKQMPNQPIGLKEISSYGAKKFAALPEREKERYKQQYSDALKEYNMKKAQLLKDCPELVKKRVRAPRARKERSARTSKPKAELPYITPFMVFREEMEKEGKVVKYHDAQVLYKNLPDVEKMKYIQKLTLLDTHLEKQFSVQECKIMRMSNGMPPKPLNPYNSFIKDLCRENALGDKKEMLKTSSNIWKTMDTDKKKEYEDKYKKELALWQDKMEKWIKTLPIEQRVEQMAKHTFLSKNDAGKKRRRENTVVEQDTTIKLENQTVSEITAPETPKKKKMKMIESDVSSIESTPKKKKFKEKIASLGVYPSLSTAHYFMSQKYAGKPQKVSKAYSKLTKEEKKRLYQEMKVAKSSYFGKLKKFAQENEKEALKIQQFHENNRKEQQDTINWHTGQGTDQSDDSDSNDSDSS